MTVGQPTSRPPTTAAELLSKTGISGCCSRCYVARSLAHRAPATASCCFFPEDKVTMQALRHFEGSLCVPWENVDVLCTGKLMAGANVKLGIMLIQQMAILAAATTKLNSVVCGISSLVNREKGKSCVARQSSKRRWSTRIHNQMKV